jgi:hypothetical protein
MSGNKYTVALTQIAALLKGSKHAMSMAPMSVKPIAKRGTQESWCHWYDYGPAINEGSHQEMGPRSWVHHNKRDEATPLAWLIQAEALAWVDQEAEGRGFANINLTREKSGFTKSQKLVHLL